MNQREQVNQVEFDERDVKLLLFFWDAARSIEAVLSHGLFSSSQTVARRINKLRRNSLIRRKRRIKAKATGRPLTEFFTDKDRFVSQFDNNRSLRGFMEALAQRGFMPDWERLMRNHSDFFIPDILFRGDTPGGKQ